MSRIVFPTTLHIATATLPAGGEWTAQAAQNGMASYDKIAFLVSYTAASDTGRPSFRVQWTDGFGNICWDGRLITFVLDGTEVNSTEGIDTPAIVAPGNGQGINIMVSAVNPGGMKKVALRVAEAGDPDHPGAISVSIQASGT